MGSMKDLKGQDWKENGEGEKEREQREEKCRMGELEMKNK